MACNRPQDKHKRQPRAQMHKMPSPRLVIQQRQRKPHLHHIPFRPSTSQNGHVGERYFWHASPVFLPSKRKVFGTRTKKIRQSRELGALRSPLKLTKTRKHPILELQSRFQSLQEFWSAGPAKTQKTVGRRLYDNQHQWLSLLGPPMEMWALSLAPKHTFGNAHL